MPSSGGGLRDEFRHRGNNVAQSLFCFKLELVTVAEALAGTISILGLAGSLNPICPQFGSHWAHVSPNWASLVGIVLYFRIRRK